MLIGLLKVLSLELKTKEAVDHAGHSQPLVLWKVSANSDMELLKASQNNNLSTVQAHTEIKDATEV